MKLVMAVSADEYELPIAVEPTREKLAEKLGVSLSTVAHAIQDTGSKSYRGEFKGMRIIRVECSDD